MPCFSNSESGPQKLLIWSSFRNHKNLKIRFKAWKNFTLCEFEVEHAFPNQSHPLPSFDHHHALPGAYLRCILLTLYQIQSLSVDVLMQALKKKIVPSAQEVSIHFLIKMFLKNNPLPPLTHFVNSYISTERQVFALPGLFSTWSSPYRMKEVDSSEELYSCLVIQG